MLINNYHSYYIFKHASRFQSIEILTSFKVNIIPMLELSNFFIKLMKKNRNRMLISILSELTKSEPSLCMGIYTAEKSYINKITEHWEKELGGYGIKVVNISPRMLNTEFNSQIDKRYLDEIKKKGGYSKIEDIINLLNKIIKSPSKYCGKNILA